MDTLLQVITDKSNNLLKEDTNIPIKEYIINIRNKYYPDLDISFMDFFMDMYMNNTPISAELLSDYGVLSIKPDRKTLHNTTIQRLFKRCHLIENIDYIFRPQLGPKSKGAPKNIYHLSPDAFKICLISSENENKYRNYFLFLEKCIHYYNLGQVNMLNSKVGELIDHTTKQDIIIIEKKDKIDILLAKIDKEREESNRQHEESMKQIDELLKQGEKSQQKMDSMQDTLNKIVKKLDDRAVPPSDDELTERFVLMKKKDNDFYVIRTQERRLNKAISEKEKLGYTKISALSEYEVIPNSIYLWNCIRDELSNSNKITCRYNDISLLKISETDFIRVIKQVFESRKELN